MFKRGIVVYVTLLTLVFVSTLQAQSSPEEIVAKFEKCGFYLGATDEPGLQLMSENFTPCYDDVKKEYDDNLYFSFVQYSDERIDFDLDADKALPNGERPLQFYTATNLYDDLRPLFDSTRAHGQVHFDGDTQYYLKIPDLGESETGNSSLNYTNISLKWSHRADQADNPILWLGDRPLYGYAEQGAMHWYLIDDPQQIADGQELRFSFGSLIGTANLTVFTDNDLNTPLAFGDTRDGQAVKILTNGRPLLVRVIATNNSAAQYVLSNLSASSVTPVDNLFATSDSPEVSNTDPGLRVLMVIEGDYFYIGHADIYDEPPPFNLDLSHISFRSADGQLFSLQPIANDINAMHSMPPDSCLLLSFRREEPGVHPCTNFIGSFASATLSFWMIGDAFQVFYKDQLSAECPVSDRYCEFDIIPDQSTNKSDSGLIAYFPFNNGNANDESGNNHHAVMGNGAALDSGAACDGLILGGENTYVLIPESTDFDLDTFSIAVWVRTESTSDYQTVISRSEGKPGEESRNFGIFVNSDDGPFTPGTVHTSFTVAPGVFHAAQGQSVITDGAFHFVVATFHPLVGLQLYIDGVDETTDALSLGYGVGAIPSTVSTPIGIGLNISNESDSYGSFRGGIDEIRIYNRALSADEIRHLFQSVAEADCSTSAQPISPSTEVSTPPLDAIAMSQDDTTHQWEISAEVGQVVWVEDVQTSGDLRYGIVLQTPSGVSGQTLHNTSGFQSYLITESGVHTIVVTRERGEGEYLIRSYVSNDLADNQAIETTMGDYAGGRYRFFRYRSNKPLYVGYELQRSSGDYFIKMQLFDETGRELNTNYSGDSDAYVYGLTPQPIDPNKNYFLLLELDDREPDVTVDVSLFARTFTIDENCPPLEGRELPDDYMMLSVWGDEFMCGRAYLQVTQDYINIYTLLAMNDDTVPFGLDEMVAGVDLWHQCFQVDNLDTGEMTDAWCDTSSYTMRNGDRLITGGFNQIPFEWANNRLRYNIWIMAVAYRGLGSSELRGYIGPDPIPEPVNGSYAQDVPAAYHWTVEFQAP